MHPKTPAQQNTAQFQIRLGAVYRIHRPANRLAAKAQCYLSREANQGQQNPFPSALNLREFYQELGPILTERPENLR